jgi:NADPH:quinone reductase-like Zn-dependent oxidoreductase
VSCPGHRPGDVVGADVVIDHTADVFTQTDERFDVVLDAVGKRRLVRCRPLLKPAGAFPITDLAREPRPAPDRRDPLGR